MKKNVKFKIKHVSGIDYTVHFYYNDKDEEDNYTEDIVEESMNMKHLDCVKLVRIFDDSDVVQLFDKIKYE